MLLINSIKIILRMQQKNSSVTTILAILSNMVGAAMLNLPIIYRDYGIISSTLVLGFSALISFITCRIYVLHSNEEDKDVEWTIRRILGHKWENFFRFISGLYLILLSIIFLDLIVDQFYSIIYLICNLSGSSHAIADKSSFDFSQFSTQWLSLLLFAPLLALMFIKNMNLLVKLSQYGTISIFIYAIYVFIQFLVTAIAGEINWDNITWFSFDALGQAGTCSLAFTVHTIVITLVKQNKNQKNNERDIGLTYLTGFFLYEMMAVLGTFAVSNKKCSNTLIDCYLTDWTILFVEITYLFGRIAVLPCTLQVGRTRILELLYGNVSQKNFKYFNIGFMVVGTLFSILSPYLSISLLMNLVGAVVCYFFIYLIPIKIHYACLYQHAPKEERSIVDLNKSLEDESLKTTSTCNHQENYAEMKPLFVRNMVYGGINLIGIAIGIFGIYSSVKQIVSN